MQLEASGFTPNHARDFEQLCVPVLKRDCDIESEEFEEEDEEEEEDLHNKEEDQHNKEEEEEEEENSDINEEVRLESNSNDDISDVESDGASDTENKQSDEDSVPLPRQWMTGHNDKVQVRIQVSVQKHSGIYPVYDNENDKDQNEDSETQDGYKSRKPHIGISKAEISRRVRMQRFKERSKTRGKQSRNIVKNKDKAKAQREIKSYMR